jgi:ectoine hydroxylase
MTLTTDFTPSRPDPVVYGGAVRSDGLLPDTLEKYHREGFLLFDSFLDSRSAKALNIEVDRLRGEAPAGELSDLHRKSALIDQLVRSTELLGPVRQILGGPVYVYQSRILHRAGFDGAASPWRSDFETWRAEKGMKRMRAVSVQIMLTEATSLSSPLMLIPGSHLHYSDRSTANDPMAAVRRLVEAGEITAPTGPAGTMVLYDCNIVHGANANILPSPRASLVIVYNSLENRLDDEDAEEL